MWFQKIFIPPPPHGRSLEIPRGRRGGSKAIISEGRGGSWETTFPEGGEPRTKHWESVFLKVFFPNSLSST